MFNVVLVNAHLTKMRPLKLFLEILPGIFFFFSLLPIHRKRDIKTGRSCLRTNIEATQREGSTYTIIRSRNLLGGRSLAVLLPPALSPPFFSFIPMLLFKIPSLASLFLPRDLPLALFVSTFSCAARFGSYRHSLFLHVLPTRLHLLFFSSSVSIVSSENFKSGSNCSKSQQAQTHHDRFM